MFKFLKTKLKTFDLFIIIFFFLITVISRIPFLSKTPYHWDSVQFALSISQFDVSLHQPQPPGYIIYVFIAKIINFLIPDAHLSLLILSILFSGLATSLLYLLGRSIFDRYTGLAASCLFISSPLIWFQGEVAFSYIVEAFFVILLILVCYQIGQGNSKLVFLSAIILGISGGVRQNTFLLLLPIFLYSLRTQNKRTYLFSTLILVLTVLMWFLPMVYLSKGFISYHSTVNRQWEYVVKSYTVFYGGWPAFINNFVYLLNFIIWSLCLGLIPFIIYLYYLVRNKMIFSNKKSIFFLFWIVPSSLFYLTVHINNPGYIMTFAPALFLICGKAISFLSPKIFRRNFLLITLCLFNLLIFIFSPLPVSVGEIKNHDFILSEKVKTIKHNFPADKTLILTLNYFYYGFRHAQYYLPDYCIYQLNPQAVYCQGKFLGGKEYRFKKFKDLKIPSYIKYIVFFQDYRSPASSITCYLNPPPLNLNSISTPRNHQIYYLLNSPQNKIKIK